MNLSAVSPRRATRDRVRLDQHDIDAGFREMQRCRQTGEAAADDYDVGLSRSVEQRILRDFRRREFEEGRRKRVRHSERT